MDDFKIFLMKLFGKENLQADTTLGGIALSTITSIYFMYHFMPETNIPKVDIILHILAWAISIYLLVTGVPKSVKKHKMTHLKERNSRYSGDKIK